MKRTLIISIGLLAIAVLTAVLTTDPVPVHAGDASVTFSHAVHKDLADCATCHAAAGSTVASDNLLPTPDACSSCHEAADVRSYWGLGDDADLSTVTLPVKDRKLYFSHAFHTEKAGMNCESCHGAILADDDAGMPDMESCYTCHNNAEKIAPITARHAEGVKSKAATNQCEACHVTLAGLTPSNHRTANFSQLHGKFASEGEADRDCAVCHSASFCQSCHTPTNDVPLRAEHDRFYIPLHPRGEKIDDGRMLTVQAVHSLTYRYTHGFDARAQSSRCATCHEAESFCTPCHQNGYDATGVRVVPQSHQLAGFVTLGQGAALNRHGKLAKMDMESCATCHEVNGGDPVCAMCHSSGIVTGGTR